MQTFITSVNPSSEVNSALKIVQEYLQ